MQKLNGRTFDSMQKSIKQLKELFPESVTDQKMDMEKLRRLLGEQVENEKERYELTWNGKKQAIQLAGKQTTATLRPCKAESVHWDSTQNLYIEGDNLEVLRVLQHSYRNKVKMIYIDPPYNTGKDFVYQDDFSENVKDYRERMGENLKSNSDTNGRFHTNWLNMMYPRLKLAKNLLQEDGIIFISIDDHELYNLRKVCDEIFGEENFVANLIIEGTPKNDPYIVSTVHEYCLVYVRNFDKAKKSIWGIEQPFTKTLYSIIEKARTYHEAENLLEDYYRINHLKSDNISNYKFVDRGGIFRIGPIDDPQDSGLKDTRYHPSTGKKLVTPKRGWSCTKETWDKWIEQNLIFFPKDERKQCAKKTYLELGNLEVLRSIQKFQIRKDTHFLRTLFDGKKVFSFPKPLDFIEKLILNCCHSDDIVLDFFSGSATIANAVMEINAKENRDIQYILVQLQEPLKLDLARSPKEKKIVQNAIDFLTEQQKVLNICEIGKERIRRVGSMIKEKYKNYNGIDDLDIGFKVFKLAGTNLKIWDEESTNLEQDLFEFLDLLKEGRTQEDVVYEILLKYGMKLTAPIEERMISGKKVFSVENGDLLICLEQNLTLQHIENLAQLRPTHMVFYDEGFQDDTVRINVKYLLKQYGVQNVRVI